MIEIDAGQVTPALRALFGTDAPQARRCFAVLDGTGHPGKIFTENPANPIWGAVQEGYDGVLYLEGKLDAAMVAQVFATLQQDGEVLACLYPDDPRLDLLPPCSTAMTAIVNALLAHKIDCLAHRWPFDCLRLPF